MLEPDVHWMANTHFIWVGLIFKHGSFGEANTALKSYTMSFVSFKKCQQSDLA